jgi:hypothetical protein
LYVVDGEFAASTSTVDLIHGSIALISVSLVMAANPGLCLARK